MSDKKFITYSVKILYPEIKQHYGSWNSTLAKKQQEEAALQQQAIENNFYRAINKIVELGGYICMEKKNLYDYNILQKQFTVKLPEGTVDELMKQTNYIKGCTPI